MLATFESLDSHPLLSTIVGFLMLASGSFFFGHTIGSAAWELGAEHAVALCMVIGGALIVLRRGSQTSGGFGLIVAGIFFLGHTIGVGKYSAWEVGLEHMIAGATIGCGAILIILDRPVSSVSDDAPPWKPRPRRRSREHQMPADSSGPLNASPSMPRRNAAV